MLRRSACGMKRSVVGAGSARPIEGTKTARSATAAADRNALLNEIMLPCPALVSALTLRDSGVFQQCETRTGEIAGLRRRYCPEGARPIARIQRADPPRRANVRRAGGHRVREFLEFQPPDGVPGLVPWFRAHRELCRQAIRRHALRSLPVRSGERRSGHRMRLSNVPLEGTSVHSREINPTFQ